MTESIGDSKTLLKLEKVVLEKSRDVVKTDVQTEVKAKTEKSSRQIKSIHDFEWLKSVQGTLTILLENGAYVKHENKELEFLCCTLGLPGGFCETVDYFTKIHNAIRLRVGKEYKRKEDKRRSIQEMNQVFLEYKNRALGKFPKFSAGSLEGKTVQLRLHSSQSRGELVVFPNDVIWFKTYDAKLRKDVKSRVKQVLLHNMKQHSRTPHPLEHFYLDCNDPVYLSDTVKRILANNVSFDQTDPISHLYMYWLGQFLNARLRLVAEQTYTKGFQSQQWDADADQVRQVMNLKMEAEIEAAFDLLAKHKIKISFAWKGRSRP